MSSESDIEAISWEKLQPGLKREFSVELTPDLLKRFAECSGDFNPIHTSSDHARKRGFSNKVAHGMLLGALLSRMVGHHLPGQNGLLLSSSFKFNCATMISASSPADSMLETRIKISGGIRLFNFTYVSKVDFTERTSAEASV